MNNRKLIIGITIVILIVVFSMIGVKMVEKNSYITEKYYNEIFDSAITIYGEVSAILMYETQKEIDSVKKEVKKIINNIEVLETNFETKEGEEIISEIMLSANEAIRLQEEKISGSDTYNFKDSQKAIDSVEAGLKEIEKVMNEKEIKFTR